MSVTETHLNINCSCRLRLAQPPGSLPAVTAVWRAIWRVQAASCGDAPCGGQRMGLGPVINRGLPQRQPGMLCLVSGSCCDTLAVAAAAATISTSNMLALAEGCAGKAWHASSCAWLKGSWQRCLAAGGAVSHSDAAAAATTTMGIHSCALGCFRETRHALPCVRLTTACRKFGTSLVMLQTTSS
jgi:hypothetical protein